MLEWRLEAYRRWLTMTEPTWARVNYPRIDYQELYYYSAPKPKKQIGSLDEIDPEILKTYEKLGIPLREVEVLEGVVKPEGEREFAVDAVFDSVSVATTFQKELKAAGVIFMPISEAIREHPELVKKYLGSVVPTSDNYFATLNSAVFSDGSFVYVPPGVRCPMELSTYFRINERNTGQFERTLIIADKGSYVSYLEGCTAPQRDENQLHAAHRKATGARNFTACDSLLIGDKCGAHTVPYVEAKNSSATFEHEATTSKISEDVLFYCVQRGLSQEEAVGLVVNGFVKDVLQQLPMEFAVEAQKLISISLEGSVG